MEITVNNEKQAIEIATQYLNNQEFANQYLQDSIVVEEKTNSWTIMIKHVNWKNQRPAFGMITVDKYTGVATWLPLR